MNNLLKLKINFTLRQREVRTFVTYRIFSFFFPMLFVLSPAGLDFGHIRKI